MNTNNTTIEATGEPLATSDVLIVGAGIIGLAHAALALDKGLSVTVIDRDHLAVGASVRNFGHACITAQSGELYELAQNGRKHWLAFARRAGFWAAESGALVVAGTRTELAVLREFAAARPPGQITLLDAESVRSRLGREDTAGILGGAFLADDLRVDPRTTVGTLAAWVDAGPGGRVMFNTAALGFGSGTRRTAAVHTSRGRLEADQVFVCVGHDVDYLFPELAAGHKIKRCTLQMTSAQAPAGTRIAEAVLTATSMLRYAAFTEVPSAEALRNEVSQQAPELLEIGANLMFTQRPDGTLLLGDSHAYHATADPFLAEDTTNRLLRAAQEVLGAGDLHLTERWQGIYASSEVAPLFIKDIGPGITAVSVTAGIGMTISFGLAERNLASL
ncbi:TIGR03364 family FAD-dependent oxidoreductase [Paeniglutamicibacter cryotolerans]|uniref:FAD dependent oxidoreductase TIGR03364 n=1 Tax=Paeniglutamicibacter cryotolerans TaxID=670079 RepID=A0A839QU77_9MICC|nr:TIGR03364 family FAD-dependent oxidoreductase [Paeniglutamicibacter cryotolerans]MBB2995581.1 FAD dependent oxidoreductase TIGR03364 [Paeniglutamicibacter cryotolerans]